MDKTFWQQKWETNQIAFHTGEANPLLIRHINSLSLAAGSRIFIPLCGKTLDIAWLLSEGYRVAGVELVNLAIEQLFEELGQTPEISVVGGLKHYGAPNIDIFAGDIFALSKAVLGSVDAVYDRAAFVALSAEMRSRYVTHVVQLTNCAPQLLITYEYDQAVMNGPPFSFSEHDVNQYYSYLFFHLSM